MTVISPHNLTRDNTQEARPLWETDSRGRGGFDAAMKNVALGLSLAVRGSIVFNLLLVAVLALVNVM